VRAAEALLRKVDRFGWKGKRPCGTSQSVCEGEILMRPAVLWIVTGFAMALTAPIAAQPSNTKGDDPDEIICERQSVIGSRLAKKKVCMTRQQWQEKRRDDRDTVDKQQVASPLRCVPPNICG
jgi:hypothetical protein